MTTFGVTPQGFVLKRLADILSDMQVALAGVTDPVTGETLTPNLADENDPLVQVVNAVADSIAECWEQLQLCYDMFDPLSSSGQGLQALVQLNGLTALGGTYSTVVVNLTGTPNSTMVAGAQFGDQPGVITFNLPAVTFDVDGNAIGVIGTCTEVGPNAPDPNTAGVLTRMVTPQSNWGSITNVSPVTPGTAQETDEQLRARQQISTSNTAGTIPEAWYSALRAVSGVTYARIYQNVTASPDSNSIPGNSIAPVVVGGDDTDVANCILSKFSVCQTYGSTSVTLTDNLGTSYTISFSRPVPIVVYMDLTIHVIDSGVWPDNGTTLIQDAIVAFVEGGMAALGITSVYDQSGYVPGQGVYASDFYAAIMTIPGVQIQALTVGLTAGPTGQSAAITWDQIASILAENITITTV